MNDLATRAVAVGMWLSAAVALLGLLLLVVQAGIHSPWWTVPIGTWRIPGAIGLFAAGLFGYIPLDRAHRRRTTA